MKDNSGKGKAQNNMRDPTLDEQQRKGSLESRGDFTEGAPFDIAGNANVRGEHASPSHRTRGETSASDATHHRPGADAEGGSTRDRHQDSALGGHVATRSTTRSGDD